MVSPERLGKYELVRFLASGGMARIYLARVSGVGGFERHVVLKTVRPERIEDDAYLAMFLDEARLLATLHHQHVAQVYEVGVADDGTYFLAMEYVHGETLRSVLGRAKKTGVRVPLDFALTAVCAAASGLHHAHDRRGTDGQPLSIVHRDVSPSNVIAGYDGSVKLIDFGIAKAAARSTVTQTGYVKGKAGYMSPEQALGYPVDRRTDVFALGIVLYELTTQKRAFRAATEHESVQRMVRGQVTAPSKIVPGFPPELEDIILTALEVDPDDRFGDVDGMQHAIELAAQHLGVRLAPHAIARTLGDLFGARPEPWLAGSPLSDEEDPTTATESGVRIAMAMDPPVVSEAVPKITARGHAVVPPPVAAADVSPRAVVDAAVRREAAEREAEDQPTHRFFTVEEPEVAPERARSVTAPQRPPSLRNSPGTANGTASRPSLPAIPPPIPAAPSAPMMARQATGPVSAPAAHAAHAGPSMGLAAMPRTTSPLLAPAFEPRDLRSQVEARAIAHGTAPPPIAPPPGLPPVPPGASPRAASPTLGRSTTLPGVAPIGASPPSGPTTLPGIMAPRPVTSPGAAEPAPRATGSQPIARQPTGPQTPIAAA
ncbi:MAG: protein kinase, partial [Deltaproteobacteria bacterium]|nr:protein kinase [Deltaproteobacteria bacterium]